MTGIKDLSSLLKSMSPRLDDKIYVFCSITEEKFSKIKVDPILIFKEKEGITIILEKEAADKNNLSYSDKWSLITLNVHSDLTAIGFIALITKKLAKKKISVNVISAYYHDHLFVPYDEAKEALQSLLELSKKNY